METPRERRHLNIKGEEDEEGRQILDAEEGSKWEKHARTGKRRPERQRGRTWSAFLMRSTSFACLCGWWADPAFRTLVLVNIAAIVERADEALLPAVYREIGDEFHASPSQLGAISLARALAQALSFPLAAHLVLVMPRVSIVALGAFAWGVATAGVGLARSYIQVALWRAINGVGLALVIPSIQSLVADSADDASRGLAFGWLTFVTNWGNILGGGMGVSLAGLKPFGVPGWRVAFHLVAVVSVLLAGLVHLFARDPTLPSFQAASSDAPQSPEQEQLVPRHDGTTPAPPPRQPADVPLPSNASARPPSRKTLELWRSAMTEAVGDTRRVLRIPSFRIIVAQGLVGSFAWCALAFCAMWLELIGFSHSATAGLLTAFGVSTCLGALFGGWFGDAMAKKHPDSGRVVVAQISSGCAVVCSFVILRLIPQSVASWWLYLAAFIITGSVISWNAAATNNPIFAEIVPKQSRTNVYALDRTFEVGFSAFAPAAVGYLSEALFGYHVPSSPSETDHNPKNADALSGGLFVVMAVPFGVCCLVYGLLYRTYPRDRNVARAEGAAEGLVREVPGRCLEGGGKHT